MSLKQELEKDAKTALKAGDKRTVGVLRMLKARILEREVEFRAQRGRDYELTDDETMEVLIAYAKQRRQSIESYRSAERSDLVEQEERELKVVEQYLPQQLSTEDIEALVVDAIAETGASGLSDLGRVMKTVMSKARGTVDGRLVNQIVKQRLLALK